MAYISRNVSAAESYTLVRFEIDSGVNRTYHVHFIKTKYDHLIEFEVYPVSDWWGPNDTTGTSYLSQTSSDTVDEFIHGGVAMSFYGSMCWRGVWESRIYFPDGEEYWGEELKGIADLWEKCVEPWCKEYLKKAQPHLNYNE